MSKKQLLGSLCLVSLILLGLLTTTMFGESDAKPGVGGPGASATAAYMKFEGLDGECQDKDHKGWSDIASFNHEIINPMIEGRMGNHQGKPALGEILVTKEIDKSSPKLAEAICNGHAFPKVEIHLSEYFAGGTGSVVYYAYELKNVIITSYSVGGSTKGEEVPMEEFSLNFEEIKWTYMETDSKGVSEAVLEFTWNVEEAQP